MKKAKKDIKERTISISTVLGICNDKDIIDNLMERIESDKDYLADTVKQELHYAKWETDSYKSQKRDASIYAKRCQKIQKEYEQAISKLKEVKKTLDKYRDTF